MENIAVALEQLWADRRRWVSGLHMIMPHGGGLRLLVMDNHPDHDRTVAGLSAQAGAGSTIVSFDRSPGGGRRHLGRSAGQDGQEFHTGRSAPAGQLGH